MAFTDRDIPTSSCAHCGESIHLAVPEEKSPFEGWWVHDATSVPTCGQIAEPVDEGLT